jgi:threonine/homoserine efflux transporter RhtA
MKSSLWTELSRSDGRVAAILGLLVLNETVTLGMIVGFVLVILGSALATRRVAEEAPAPR